MAGRAALLGSIKASGANPFVVCAVTFRRSRQWAAVPRVRVAEAIDRALEEFASGRLPYSFGPPPHSGPGSVPEEEAAERVLAEVGGG